MKKVEIDEKTALEIYSTGSPKTKKLLTEKFGKEIFVPKLREKVKSVQDACKLLKVDYKKFLKSLKGLSKDEIGYRKIKIVIKAIRGNWKPDPNKDNQLWYYPYFRKTPKGFVFCRVACADYGSGVGSSLVLETEEDAKYIGETFIAEYNEYMS